MAREILHLQGSMFPTHQSPHVAATFEFEQPMVQGNKLMFRPVSLNITGLNMAGPAFMQIEKGQFDQQTMILALSATAHQTREDVRSIGAMSLNPACLKNNGNHYWYWELTDNDILQIQEKNHHDLDIPFELEVQGILGVSVPDKGYSLFSVQGSNQFRIPRTTWNNYIELTGYTGRFPQKMDIKSAVTGDKWWDAATNQLSIARRQLHHGNTYFSLEACLSAIEKETPAPYTEHAWKEFLEKRGINPNSKVEAMAKLFAGIGTYLNKVGHHFSRDERNQHTGDFVRPPLDAYEAEILVGMSQLMLTYTERLKEQYPLLNAIEDE